MGWWSFPEDESVVVADEVMDATYDYFERVTALYEEALKRKPSIAEVQAMLRLALSINGEKYIEDLPDTKQIDSVTLKLKARPKRQKYQVGDFMAIPLSDGRYMFGRIINLEDGWDLVEVFAYVADNPRYRFEITQARRLVPPINVDPQEALGKGGWRIIHSEPGYDAPDLRELEYVMGTPGNYKLVKVGDFQPRQQLSNEEADKRPMWAMMAIEGIMEEIEEAAREQGLL
jgi:hypothetical protein